MPQTFPPCQGVYSCPRCAKKCISSRGLMQHINACHRACSPNSTDDDAAGHSFTYRYHSKLDGMSLLRRLQPLTLIYAQRSRVMKMATTCLPIHHHLWFHLQMEILDHGIHSKVVSHSTLRGTILSKPRALQIKLTRRSPSGPQQF